MTKEEFIKKVKGAVKSDMLGDYWEVSDEVMDELLESIECCSKRFLGSLYDAIEELKKV